MKLSATHWAWFALFERSQSSRSTRSMNALASAADCARAIPGDVAQAAMTRDARIERSRILIVWRLTGLQTDRDPAPNLASGLRSATSLGSAEKTREQLPPRIFRIARI